MMMDFSRKYRKIIFWTLIVLVGVPFVFITTDYIPFADRLRGSFVEGGPVAQVGNAPVTAFEVRDQLNRRVQQLTGPNQSPPTFRELYESGQVQQVLEGLINAKLIEQEVRNVDLEFARDYLDETLRNDPSFQDEQGKFDPEAWNDWVEQSRQRRINWDQVRASVSDGVRQRLLGQRVTESVRVREEELRDEFTKSHTAVRARYLTVKPAVVPTEEEIQKQYQENLSLYERPADRHVEFVAISVKPERPAVLDELLARAQQGEAFADLAQTSVDSASIQHISDTGWLAPNPDRPERDPLFELAVGQTSDVIQGPVGYHIYKVVEERTNEAGQKEVRAEELALYPVLSTEERTRRRDQAEALAAQARESGDLAAAAASAGLPVQTAGPFNAEAESIPNVDPADVASFARSLSRVEEGQVSDVVLAPNHLYVAKVTEVGAPTPRPLEEVRERVVQDVIQEKEGTFEHMQRLQELGDEIARQATSLDEIRTRYPDAASEIKELGPVTAHAFDFSSGLFLNPQDFVSQLVDAGPGKLVGPLRDMMGNVIFAELVEATPPDEKAWEEEYPEERQQIQRMLMAQRAQERFEDYLAYLKTRTPVSVSEEALVDALGLDEEDEAKPAAEDATAEEIPVETPVSDWPVTDYPRSETPSPAAGAAPVEPMVPEATVPESPAPAAGQ